jgi:hypothetical protein
LIEAKIRGLPVKAKPVTAPRPVVDLSQFAHAQRSNEGSPWLLQEFGSASSEHREILIVCQAEWEAKSRRSQRLGRISG